MKPTLSPALSEADIEAMFPDCHHRRGYGDSEYDRNRCEGMLGPCERRVAHRAGMRLLACIAALVSPASPEGERNDKSK